MSHTCEGCGLVHEMPGQLALDDAAVEASPAVVEAPPGPNDNDVAIEQIRADAEVAQAKIYAQAADVDLAAEVERLRGELAGMREGAELAAEAAAAADAPAAGPPVVVETPPAPAPAPPAIEAPPAAEESKPPREPKSSKNYFGF